MDAFNFLFVFCLVQDLEARHTLPLSHIPNTFQFLLWGTVLLVFPDCANSWSSYFCLPSAGNLGVHHTPEFQFIFIDSQMHAAWLGKCAKFSEKYGLQFLLPSN